MLEIAEIDILHHIRDNFPALLVAHIWMIPPHGYMDRRPTILPIHDFSVLSQYYPLLKELHGLGTKKPDCSSGRFYIFLLFIFMLYTENLTNVFRFRRPEGRLGFCMLVAYFDNIRQLFFCNPFYRKITKTVENPFLKDLKKTSKVRPWMFWICKKQSHVWSV